MVFKPRSVGVTRVVIESTPPADRSSNPFLTAWDRACLAHDRYRIIPLITELMLKETHTS